MSRNATTQPARKEAFERLRAELARAFSAPEISDHLLTAEMVIRRNQQRNSAPKITFIPKEEE